MTVTFEPWLVALVVVLAFVLGMYAISDGKRTRRLRRLIQAVREAFSRRSEGQCDDA